MSRSQKQLFLRRCYQLATQGKRAAMPNPCVGAVVVHKGRIIGEGHTSTFGGPHGEVNAINSIRDADLSLLPQSILFVSLEPCCHHGKTPPCTSLIIEKKIPKVVIGTLDPFPKVAGRGVKILKAAGISVEVADDQLAKDSLKEFLVNQKYKRPYITLKWAASKDFYIGKRDQQVWLSNHYSRVYAHRLRAEHQAILVGTDTVLTDNPSLTTRAYPGENPIKVVLDRNHRLPIDHSIFDKNCIVVSYEKRELKCREEVVIKQADNEVSQWLSKLYSLGITTLLVEGGAAVQKAMIKANLWDTAHVIQTPKVLESGIKAPYLHGSLRSNFTLNDDKISVVRNASLAKC